MKVSFIKYEGCGNDFVLIDWPLSRRLPPARIARLLSDRHFGVGADQVILVRREKKRQLPSRVVFYNQDGSRAEMCGNGVRAAALYLAGHDRPGAGAAILPILTDAGLRQVEVESLKRSSGHAEPHFGLFRVSMGVPALRSRSQIRDPIASEELERIKLSPSYIGVNLGNPHAVFLARPSPDVSVPTGPATSPKKLAPAQIRQRLRAKQAVSHRGGQAVIPLLGPLVETASDFPKRTNVEWVEKIGNRQIKVWVWERGAGLTLACGTGACAAAVAAIRAGLVGSGRIEVQMPGGSLWVDWDGQPHSQCYLRGPAKRVYTGDIEV